jgi:hypothetical protein
VYPTYDLAGVFFNAVRSAAFAWTKKFLPILEKALGRTVELPKRQIHSVKEFAETFPDIKDIPIRREIPKTRTPKELGAGDTEHRSAAYLGVREHSSTGSTNLESFGVRVYICRWHRTSYSAS